MLTLGIPGSPTAAVLLGGLLIWGLQPGPMLFVEQKDFVWGLIASMYLGNVVGLIIVLTCVPLFAAILRVPFSIIAPVILVICAIGAYTVNNAMFDVWMMLVFGVVGYVLQQARLSAAAAGAGDRARRQGRRARSARRMLVSQGSLVSLLVELARRRDHDARPDAAVLAVDQRGLTGLRQTGTAAGTRHPAWNVHGRQRNKQATNARRRKVDGQSNSYDARSLLPRVRGTRRRHVCRPRRGLGADQARDLHHPGRHRRRRRPDGALHPGHRHQAQPDEAADRGDQQGRRRGRRRLPRGQGQPGRSAQDHHHAVEPVHDAARHRHALQLEGPDAGRDAGARPVRAVGELPMRPTRPPRTISRP